MNDKIRTYNYLPVVRLDDWLHRDGLIIAAERIQADAMNTMRNIIHSIGFSPSILETEEPERILVLMFSQQDQKTQKARRQFEGICSKWAECAKVRSSPPEESPFVVMQRLDNRFADQLLRELVQHRLSGYYFLPAVDPDEDDYGHVVLLREVRFIPRGLAHALKAGLNSVEFQRLCELEPHYRGRIRIFEDDVAMPISILTSPHIEHLMQTFSTLFGRIGVPDTPQEYVRSLWERQPSFRGVQ